ncbi:MAG TPA: TetR/AcrR family transcriptional regulator [Luteibacter sp.]|jgi:TetR/AcrR family transcriptional repressor of nem operon|nr:TetR/AcrR family transcriptional regulator [Luteibacter sp.]
MRYDAEHKQKTREKVLKAAAKAIRADGPDRIAVAGVMAEAGLTHGGFYAHFASKEALVADAIEQMFIDADARLRHHLDGRPPGEGLASYLAFYLSPAHRDARGSGCPMAALSSDLPRLSAVSRKQFAKGVKRLIDSLAEAIAANGGADAETLARSALSEMVGALSLARIEPNSAQSAAILGGSRELLTRRLDLAVI